ncbi:hypothetical protein [Wenjunlia tyrosinilytica]|uniref:Secreted protein n=1 Tax=Wenjunlia tyrosinilytica TaxID=1544741 RepID=A0A917ZHI7_9ACTN|nr:hypothetical protein [Wenjunlia tyrosinilytica]GGO81917.1 hypothetical protein GCM10012280_07320 [Wenjunlia tyrosinilytica]
MLKRRAVLSLAAATAACVTAVAPAVASPAGPINNACAGGGYNPNNATDVHVASQETGVGNDTDAVLQMKYGYIGSTLIVWAKIYNASVGDGASLRWSDDRGANYHRCGRPANAGYAYITSGGDQYTLGSNNVNGRWFKACGYDKSSGKIDCTPSSDTWIHF